MKPACMTEREYELWSDANRVIASTRSMAVTPCSDCPLAYHQEMTAQGRCDGFPAMRRVRVDTPEAEHRRRQWREASLRRRRKLAAA